MYQSEVEKRPKVFDLGALGLLFSVEIKTAIALAGQGADSDRNVSLCSHALTTWPSENSNMQESSV